MVWIIRRLRNFFQLQDFLLELAPWGCFCRAASQGRPWGMAWATGPAQPGPCTPRSPSSSAGGGELALKTGPGADSADTQLLSGSFSTLRCRARVYGRGQLAADGRLVWPSGCSHQPPPPQCPPAGQRGRAPGGAPPRWAGGASRSPRPGGQAGPRKGPVQAWGPGM